MNIDRLNNLESRLQRCIDKCNSAPSFKNIPEHTYWINKTTGTIVSVGIYRDEYPTDINRISVTTMNTSIEMDFRYSWDNLNDKFELINREVTEEFFVKVISNKRRYQDFKWCKKTIPTLKKLAKLYGDKEDYEGDQVDYYNSLIQHRQNCVQAYWDFKQVNCYHRGGQK